MSKIYIATIQCVYYSDYEDEEERGILASCAFEDKDKATQWIIHNEHLLAEDLSFRDQARDIFYSNLNTGDELVAEKFQNSLKKYLISSLFDPQISSFHSDLTEYEVNKEGTAKYNLYFRYRYPTINNERVEQKLDAYKKEREGLARKSKKGETK